jgi:hypothetical protein
MTSLLSMRTIKWRRFLHGASLQRDVEEIRDLALRYLKEQTIQPLKELGRFVVFGVLGSIFVAVGTVMALLGVLRMLQSLFPVLDGSLSWIPYLVIAVLGIATAAMIVRRIVRGVPRRSRGAS